MLPPSEDWQDRETVRNEPVYLTSTALQLPQRPARRFLLLALALFFVLAGANHFLNPDFYLQIMPPYLPAHLELIYLSGLLEVLGGIGVLIPRYRRAAGWLLVAVIIGVTPANIHMALHPELYPAIPLWALYLRLPLQALIIAWAWWATRAGRADAVKGER